MALSALGRQFATSRSAADLEALAKKEPKTAADFLSRAAKTGHLTAPWVKQLDKLLHTKFESVAAQKKALATFFKGHHAVFNAVETGRAQAARAHTLGFTAGEGADPVELTGKLGIAPGGGNATLTTADGTFTLEMPSWPIQQSGVQSQYFEPNILQSFEGRLANIRAYPTATPGVLAVAEFSPGSDKEFVSGRLSYQGDKVGIRVRPDKWVEIKNAELAAALKNLAQPHEGAWGGTGVILKGEVKHQRGKYTFEGNPKNYWMLARANTSTTLLAGHGMAKPFDGDATPKGGHGERLLVYGNIDAAGTIHVKGALNTPQVRVESGVAAQTDAAAMMKLVPVDTHAVRGAVDQFDV